MKRMIVEGMDRDNVGLNYLIDVKSYRLGLVGRIDSEGNFFQGNNPRSIEQIIKGGIVPESTQTIIMEDGRVYSWAEQDRLKATLNDLKSACGFENAYKLIQQNPSKFYR
ncbi:hypothetical protein J4418_01750 [Candidatus Woesearchaeota archaeon]|nr:hypothetical protein [Candidatus Woesearchaeota archaeon]